MYKPKVWNNKSFTLPKTSPTNISEVCKLNYLKKFNESLRAVHAEE
ncbi:hypothetical protein OO013_09420 [Mangrovivirga sp. M17]|uniref:Uncharacterized protein n=1 Tax=Mangrovivirga halotolerans TaxID=2993936 RepID=A0ABT3RRT4_9BACT|nr:hypothetical protein [Mangrovivirga halotolerans]MCX2744084.1 hypothetical protein [Mangrovivirga halotolerans]